MQGIGNSFRVERILQANVQIAFSFSYVQHTAGE